MTKKELFHTKKGCGQRLLIEHSEDGVPYLKCEGCTFKIEDWIKWFREYQFYYTDETKWLDKKNHITCLLGWFTKLYKDNYDIDFTFSLNENGLFKGPEILQLRKLYRMLDNNVLLAKQYIKWIFDTTIKTKKRKITSLGFLVVPGIVSEFKFYVQKSRTITKTTPLPKTMLDWIHTNIPAILEMVALKDHGDLNLLLTHFKNNNFVDDENIVNFVEKLKRIKYIDTDFKIHNWEN